MSIAESTAIPLMSAEAFAALPSSVRSELVKGKVIELPPPRSFHGFVVSRFITILSNFVRSKQLGWVWGAESGIITERNPDSVRGADIIYASYQRIPRDRFPEGYCETPPELIVEVLSVDDRWPAVLQKTGEYLAAGVVAVCVVEPELKMVHVYRAAQSPVTLRAADTFTLPDILGDFSVPVSEFFE